MGNIWGNFAHGKSISVPVDPLHSATAIPTSTTNESSPSSTHPIFDVFLSFRGEDTRKTITGHLYMALKEAGINAFIDDDELRRGENITTELIRAIQGSRISIIILSSHYADSSWCLEELVKIMECRRTFGQIVMPIFYDVDPSSVRKQTGSFSQAFAQCHKDADKVLRWRAALTEASNLSGWDLRNTLDGHEAKFIRKIIKEVTEKLSNTYLHVAPYQVGIDSRMQDVSKLLDVGSKDVRMIGIWGMGGMGKTAIAKAIYNEFYDRFEGKSFIENVREKKRGKLQKQLFSDIFKSTKIKVGSVAQGITLIGQRLRSLRVLVILDDVDDAEQLYELAIKHHTFGPGSRIIITTRDEHLLKKLKVDAIYQARGMDKEEALELLSWHAFGSCSPSDKYLQLAREVVDYCGGLPLALQVLGSSLFTRSIGEWESTMDKLKRIPSGEIQKKLRISYDGLSDDYERDIFCDIACFFIGMDKSYVILILNGCGFSAEIGIKVLLERCLVKVNAQNKLMMHDLLREMGRNIVREESPKYPGKRSRLWHPEDAKDVLTRKSGTEEVEGLTLHLLGLEEAIFSPEAFTTMRRLRLLQLNYVRPTGGYECLSKNLRWLCWHGFPLQVIPKDLCLTNIVAIDMRYSSLKQVLCEDSELLGKLKILNLSHSHYLSRSPDFSKLPNLEKLILKDCKTLSKVHESIGNLKSLELVNLEDCKMLKDLPRSFYELKSVRTLVLDGCSSFGSLDEKLGNMVSLTTLRAEKTAITKVPSSITRLSQLDRLCLGYLNSPLQLPRSLQGLYSLTSLSLPYCNLKDIPKDIGSLSSLEDLDLQGNSFHSLPNLTGLSELDRLVLDYCGDLVEITGLPTGLHTLLADACTALERMTHMPETLSILRLNSSPKLMECSGLDRALNSRLILFMIARNTLTDILLTDSMLQGWTGSGQICVEANDIPTWFNHVGEGGRVHFEVPKEIGCDLKALAVCVLYFSHSRFQSMIIYGMTTYVINHTKGTCFEVWSEVPAGKSDEFLWIVHLGNNEFKLEGGDSVDVIADFTDDERLKVKKTGIRLVHDKLINFKEPVFVPYEMSIPYDKVLKIFSKYDCDEDDDDDDDEDDDDDDDGDDERRMMRMMRWRRRRKREQEAGPSHHTSKKMRLI